METTSGGGIGIDTSIRVDGESKNASPGAAQLLKSLETAAAADDGKADTAVVVASPGPVQEDDATASPSKHRSNAKHGEHSHHSRSCARRTRRNCRKGWIAVLDLLYWVWDTLRVWDCSAGTGISSSGRKRASCSDRVFRWVFIGGGALLSVFLIIWNTQFGNKDFAVQMGGLGVMFGILLSVSRAVIFHNRWLCYKRVPKRDRAKLVNVKPTLAAITALSPTSE